MSHIIHLLMAVVFIGTVFFEVVMLEGIRGRVQERALVPVEEALGARLRRIMPWVILLLFGSGLVMAHRYSGALAAPGESAFALQLSVKILLAFSVLGHFITAMTLIRRGMLNARRNRIIHYSVFGHVVVIAVLAKTMFYLG
ncbi:hypothetical protein [Halospina sp. K52047b]|uniref:CopD family copper resistance protein n=1 Tax=Halospina sp. K52047b TaxID=2614160 RepID=UPI00124AC7C2|nr:hypothetical protein [Halospina sp. K52047b]KAA8977786.1 hypothetical protein F3089_14490 [Halospina sp. K52047b]